MKTTTNIVGTHVMVPSFTLYLSISIAVATNPTTYAPTKQQGISNLIIICWPLALCTLWIHTYFQNNVRSNSKPTASSREYIRSAFKLITDSDIMTSNHYIGYIRIRLLNRIVLQKRIINRFSTAVHRTLVICTLVNYGIEWDITFHQKRQITITYDYYWLQCDSEWCVITWCDVN